jgi:hypothetical protein
MKNIQALPVNRPDPGSTSPPPTTTADALPLNSVAMVLVL